MRIGEASRISGLGPSAIRYYEAHSIVPTSDRTEAGYRDYGTEDAELLRFVHRLRSIELPLDDVRQIVALRANGDAPCSTVRAAIAREAAAIDQRIEDLTQLQDELARLQAAADQITDNWPSACVCHILDPATAD